MIYTIMIIETEQMNFSEAECVARQFVSQQYIPYGGRLTTNISKTSENSAIIEVVLTVPMCDMTLAGLIYNKIRRLIYRVFDPPRVVITSK